MKENMKKFQYPIVLFGKTGSGKTSVAKELEKYGVQRLISFTTRPMREGEKDDVDYHFVDENTFFDMVDSGKIAEITSRSIGSTDYYYGTAVENYGISAPSVCIMDLNGIRTLKVAKIPHTAILLNVSNWAAEQRCLERGDNLKEARKRLKLERMTFASASNLADIVIDANDDFPNVVQTILDNIEADLSHWMEIQFKRSRDKEFYCLYGIDNKGMTELISYVHAYSGKVLYINSYAAIDPKVKKTVECIQNNIKYNHPFSIDFLESCAVSYFSRFSKQALVQRGLTERQIAYVNPQDQFSD